MVLLYGLGEQGQAVGALNVARRGFYVGRKQGIIKPEVFIAQMIPNLLDGDGQFGICSVDVVGPVCRISVHIVSYSLVYSPDDSKSPGECGLIIEVLILATIPLPHDHRRLDIVSNMNFQNFHIERAQ